MARQSSRLLFHLTHNSLWERHYLHFPHRALGREMEQYMQGPQLVKGRIHTQLWLRAEPRPSACTPLPFPAAAGLGQTTFVVEELFSFIDHHAIIFRLKMGQCLRLKKNTI